MKVLITGSQGMLASDLTRVWSAARHEVIGLSHADLDIADPGQVRSAMERVAPDLLVNTPGIGVDTCELEPEKGFQIHTWGGANVARECERTGASLVYISTCGVFGDEVKYYSEYDPVVLKTQYARSKFMGEEAAMAACPRTFVIRPGWLFGGSPHHQRNFVYQRYQEAQQNPVLRSANDKFGSPTATSELAEKIMDLVATEAYGLYHIANVGRASRYDYVKAIVKAFGLDTTVEPVDSSAYPRPAPVPDCESLDNVNLGFLGLPPMSDWHEAVQRYVAELKKTLPK
jgi:dTDP-4-dehydrorhamnose reductase